VSFVEEKRIPVAMFNLDHDIFKAIQGHTSDHPQDLVGILALVDVRQKTVLEHEELESGLRRLIQAGQIAEAAPLHYYESAAPPQERQFSGITVEEHRQACEAYLKWFWGTDLEAESAEPTKDEFSRKKIVIHWSAAGDRHPSEEEQDAAEALAEQLDSRLASTGQAEIIGFERGPGSIDLLIFGRETDEDVDEIYHLIAPAFREFGCPPGSCIIRCYRDRGEELVSDKIGEPGDAK
jgi:hypothetical protein